MFDAWKKVKDIFPNNGFNADLPSKSICLKKTPNKQIQGI